jgi:hypothetical protein
VRSVARHGDLGVRGTFFLDPVARLDVVRAQMDDLKQSQQAVSGDVRIWTAIFSYDGGMYCCVSADYDSSNDIDILTRGIETAAAGLLELAGGRPVGRP